MGAKYTYVGHGTHLLETADHKLVIDPFFDDNPATDMKASDVEADFILVTHGHGDHISDAAAIADHTNALVISNFEIANWLSKQGVKTHGQHLGGGYTHPFGYLKLTIAFHGSGLPDGSYGGNPAGFLLTTTENEKIYFAGDTALFGDMQLYGDEGIDLAVIPIGDNFTMGPTDALRAVDLLRPKHVIPSHYNTWDLINQDAEAWAKKVSETSGTQPHVLKPGESFQL